MMTPKNLPRDLHEKAVEIGAAKVLMNFEGGSDEGSVCVSLLHGHGGQILDAGDEAGDLCVKFEEWAYRAYYFSGAGEGIPYGESFLYELKNQTVEMREWFYVREENWIGSEGFGVIEQGCGVKRA
jgi:hypothetical protein